MAPTASGLYEPSVRRYNYYKDNEGVRFDRGLSQRLGDAGEPEISDLISNFRRLSVASPTVKSPLETLPTEIILNIFRHLIANTEHDGAPNLDLPRYIDWWTSIFFRRDLCALSRTSRRLNSVATAVLYHTAHLTTARMMVSLWRSMKKKPMLAESVRHIVCDVKLWDAWVRMELNDTELFQLAPRNHPSLSARKCTKKRIVFGQKSVIGDTPEPPKTTHNNSSFLQNPAVWLASGLAHVLKKLFGSQLPESTGRISPTILETLEHQSDVKEIDPFMWRPGDAIPLQHYIPHRLLFDLVRRSTGLQMLSIISGPTKSTEFETFHPFCSLIKSFDNRYFADHPKLFPYQPDNIFQQLTKMRIRVEGGCEPALRLWLMSFKGVLLKEMQLLGDVEEWRFTFTAPPYPNHLIAVPWLWERVDTVYASHFTLDSFTFLYSPLSLMGTIRSICMKEITKISPSMVPYLLALNEEGRTFNTFLCVHADTLETLSLNWADVDMSRALFWGPTERIACLDRLVALRSLTIPLHSLFGSLVKLQEMMSHGLRGKKSLVNFVRRLPPMLENFTISEWWPHMHQVKASHSKVLRDHDIAIRDLMIQLYKKWKLAHPVQRKLLFEPRVWKESQLDVTYHNTLLVLVPAFMQMGFEYPCTEEALADDPRLGLY